MFHKLTIAAALGLCLAGSAQATTLTYDFEMTTPPASTGTIESSEGYSARGFGSQFLRAVDNGAGAYLDIILPGFTANMVDISFDLAIIDSWDGWNGSCCGPDGLGISVDGTELLHPYFAIALGSDAGFTPAISETGSAAGLGFNSNWNDRSFKVNLTGLSHVSGDDLVLTLFFPGFQGLNDESFAVDNVSFTFSEVPVPASLPLLLAGFGALGLVRRRR